MKISCLAVVALALSLAGCSTWHTRPSAERFAAEADDDSRSSSLTGALTDSWRRVTGGPAPPTSRDWTWQSGIVTGLPRAEQVPAELPRTLTCQLLPDVGRQEFQLVSTAPPPSYRVVNVNGQPISHYGDLLRAVAEVAPARDKLKFQVDVAAATSDQPGGDVAVHVEKRTLQTLPHAVGLACPAVKVSDAGQQWIVICDGGVMAKLTVRLERSAQILHVVLTIRHCVGPELQLPVDVRARCEGRPLACLTCNETLERLYSPPKKASSETIVNANGDSFAAVSERDEYLIPTQYNRLTRIVASADLKPAQPAFATIPGIGYPGPPLLGDSRALAGCLMQRDKIKAGDAEHTGWINFSGPSLSEGRKVEIDVDLGTGPKTYRFEFPSLN